MVDIITLGRQRRSQGDCRRGAQMEPPGAPRTQVRAKLGLITNFAVCHTLGKGRLIGPVDGRRVCEVGRPGGRIGGVVPHGGYVAALANKPTGGINFPRQVGDMGAIWRKTGAIRGRYGAIRAGDPGAI